MGEYNAYNVCHVGEEMPMFLFQTHVYHVVMYLCKVDFMVSNTFTYVAIILNYNKVMCII
jgi:hypothetical protein